MRHRPHNRGITGMYTHEITDTLRYLEIPHQHKDERAIQSAHNGKRPTLRRFVETTTTGPWIVHVGRHLVAVCDTTVADNQTRFGCPIDEHPDRRRRVKQAWLILNHAQADHSNQ